MMLLLVWLVGCSRCTHCCSVSGGCICWPRSARTASLVRSDSELRDMAGRWEGAGIVERKRFVAETLVVQEEIEQGFSASSLCHIT